MVSNPFRTGRYCAGRILFLDRTDGGSVSNPFRTGRYCAVAFDREERDLIHLFQTPSERGGIVLTPTSQIAWQDSTPRFKPLQNGAVLCCHPDADADADAYPPFQTPSERGGIVLAVTITGRTSTLKVSNPFRTGRYCADTPAADGTRIVNLVSNPFRTGRYCAGLMHCDDTPAERGFKPLQNGAVLCCRGGGIWGGRGDRSVSNPFRTGRYCAVGAQIVRTTEGARCFKPLQNGAVLCCGVEQPANGLMHWFQTPSERGGIVLPQ